MKEREIRAEVMWDWDNPRCKFYQGDKAIVDINPSSNFKNIPKTLSDRQGQIGEVIAVTCTSDGKIRGSNDSGFFNLPNRRMYTKYYLKFEDKQCYGFHSHYIEKV